MSRAFVMMGGLFVWVLQGASVACAQSAAANLEGVTESSLREHLGPPTSEGQGGGVERLEYSTPAGPLVFYAQEGRVSLHRPVRQAEVPPPIPAKPKDLAKAARKQAKTGDIWGALALVGACLRLDPISRPCNDDLQKLSTKHWKDFAKRFDKATEDELATIDEFARGVLALQPPFQPMREAHGQTHAALRRINEPRIAAARTAFLVSRFDSAMRAAHDALIAGDYANAREVVAPFAADPGVAARTRATTATWIDVRVTSIEAISATLRSIAALREALGDNLAAQFRRDTVEHAAEFIRARINVGPTNAAVARAIKEVVVRNVPDLAQESDPGFWQRIAARRPMLTLQTRVAIAGACQSAIPRDEIVDTVRRSLPGVFVSTDESDVTANIQVSCRSEVSRGRTEPIPSEYQASTEQLANPENARVQGELLVAHAQLEKVRARWEKDPPTGDAAIDRKNKEIGRAVREIDDWTDRLRGTAAYIDRPVYASYSAYGTAVTKTATVSVEIVVAGSGIEPLRSQAISMEWRATDREIAGVMSSDRRGLRNGPANLPADVVAHGLAFRSMNPERIPSRVRGMTEQAASAMLNAVSKTGNPLEVIGTALLVSDVTGREVPAEFRGLRQQLGAVGLDGVRTFRTTPVGLASSFDVR